MNIDRIIEDELIALDNICVVTYANTHYDNSNMCSGFGLAPGGGECITTPLPEFILHMSYSTKPYRDEQCAVYKVLQFMKDEVIPDTNRFFRYKPEVIKYNDLDRDYTRFVGRVRFTITKG